MTGLELINQYQSRKVAASKEIQRLQFMIDDVSYALEDSKPDLSEHVTAQRTLVQQKRDAFWKELSDGVMTEDFTRKWQMKAIVALANVLPHAQSAMSVVKTADGAACVAYCLTGALERKAVDALLPGKFVNGMSQSATADDLLTYRRAEMTHMCESLGVCERQLQELRDEEAVLNTLTDF
jgi:hypothetical protein